MRDQSQTIGRLTQLSSWIDPVEVLDTLIRIEANEAILSESNTLLLQSSVLEGGSEGRFDRMIARYLHQFELPHSIMVLTLAWYNCSDISLRTVAALAGLRFDGTIASYDWRSLPHHLPRDTVLTIEASEVLIELVKNPCAALLDMVSTCVAFWREKRNVIESPHVATTELVPSAPSPLQIFVESEVATCFGATTKPADLAVPRINHGFRAVTVSGQPPLPETWVNGVRAIISGQAPLPETLGGEFETLDMFLNRAAKVR